MFENDAVEEGNVGAGSDGSFVFHTNAGKRAHRIMETKKPTLINTTM